MRGYYQRRRGILEHIQDGRLTIFEAGIHDFLCLQANPIVGGYSSRPPGVVYTSSAAIAAVDRTLDERQVRRALEKLEKGGYIRTYKVNGRRGNYPAVIGKFLCRDLSGMEFTVSLDKTIDWQHPFLEPCRDNEETLPGNSKVTVTVRSQSGHSSVTACPVIEEVITEELKTEKGEEVPSSPDFAFRSSSPVNPAKSTAILGDDLAEQFLTHARDSFKSRHGAEPSPSDKSWNHLSVGMVDTKLKEFPLAELIRRWDNFMASTDQWHADKSGDLAWFLGHTNDYIKPKHKANGASNAQDREDRNRAVFQRAAERIKNANRDETDGQAVPNGKQLPAGVH